MGENRLEELLKLRDIIEEIDILLARQIKSEQLANAIVKLANNQGVMFLLESQKLQDNVEGGN